MLEACVDRLLTCHHFDFLDSRARKYWENLSASNDYDEFIKVLFLTANSQDVQELRKLAENLGLDEAKEASTLNRGQNRRTTTLTRVQLTQWIKDWRLKYEIGYKNISDDDLSETRMNEVCTSVRLF